MRTSRWLIGLVVTTMVVGLGFAFAESAAAAGSIMRIGPGSGGS